MKKFFSKEKGITMLALTLTIIVMAVIMSVITFYVRNSVQTEQFQKMKADISEIESKALMYYVKEGIVPVYSGENSDKKTRSQMSGSSEFFNPNDGNEYAKVNLELLGVVTSYDTTYYINTDSLTVYAADPIEMNKKVYPRMAGKFTKISMNNNVSELEEYCFSTVDEKQKKFTYNEDGYITGIEKGVEKNVDILYIPAAQPNGQPVVGIAMSAFDDVTVSNTLVIPSTIKSMPSNLFGKNSNVKKIYCNGSGLQIDTFSMCPDVEEVIIGPSCVIPSGTETTGLFSGKTKLQKARVETKSIGEGTFAGCTSLKLVELNNNIKVIPDYCFENCTSIKMTTIGTISTTTGITFPSSIERIGTRAFYNVGTFATTLNLADYPNLVFIGSEAFAGTNITRVTLKDSMKYQSDSFPSSVEILRR